MTSWNIIQNNPERYPKSFSDPMVRIMAIQEMWARFDTEMHVFKESCKYLHSRKYKKAMKKIAKESGVVWCIETPLGEHVSRLQSVCKFPSEMEAAYWLERYISSGMFPSTAFMCKQADSMNEIKKRTKYEPRH
jgi:hypothetical protein